MNRIDYSAGSQIAFPPAEADESRDVAAFQPALYRAAATALSNLAVRERPATDTKQSGHIPAQGPTGETMPFYDQGNSNGCGTTSLSMIFRYFGIDISREEIDNAIRRTDLSLGSTPGDLIEYARSHGLAAEGYNNGTWEQMKSLIDQGVPCMASIDNGNGGRHLIVITGYETGADGKERVLYHDPELGDENGVPGQEQSMSLDDFKKAWGENTFGVTNYFMAFAPQGTELPKGTDKGAEGALGTVAGAANVVNGWDRIFSPDDFGSVIHGIPELFGGAFQTVGCGVGALLQTGASWLSNKVDGIPVLQNIVKPFTDMVSGAGASIADVFNGFGEACDSMGGAFESLCHGDVSGFVSGVGDSCKDVVGGAVDAVGDAVDSVGDAIGDLFSW